MQVLAFVALHSALLSATRNVTESLERFPECPIPTISTSISEAFGNSPAHFLTSVGTKLRVGWIDDRWKRGAPRCGHAVDRDDELARHTLAGAEASIDTPTRRTAAGSLPSKLWRRSAMLVAVVLRNDAVLALRSRSLPPGGANVTPFKQLDCET